MLGRTFAAATVGVGERQAVLSWDLWRTHFGGDANALGRSLVLNGEPYTVVGVMPRTFQGYEQGTAPWALQRNDAPESPFGQPGMEHRRRARYLDVLARLRPRRSLGQATAELAALASRLGPP